jgi:hypothetical protein
MLVRALRRTNRSTRRPRAAPSKRFVHEPLVQDCLVPHSVAGGPRSSRTRSTNTTHVIARCVTQANPARALFRLVRVLCAAWPSDARHVPSGSGAYGYRCHSVVSRARANDFGSSLLQAEGFVRVANEAMCRPIRALTQARGYSLTDHTLACFGGAGRPRFASRSPRRDLGQVVEADAAPLAAPPSVRPAARVRHRARSGHALGVHPQVLLAALRLRAGGRFCHTCPPPPIACEPGARRCGLTRCACPRSGPRGGCAGGTGASGHHALGGGGAEHEAALRGSSLGAGCDARQGPTGGAAPRGGVRCAVRVVHACYVHACGCAGLLKQGFAKSDITVPRRVARQRPARWRLMRMRMRMRAADSRLPEPPLQRHRHRHHDFGRRCASRRLACLGRVGGRACCVVGRRPRAAQRDSRPPTACLCPSTSASTASRWIAPSQLSEQRCCCRYRRCYPLTAERSGRSACARGGPRQHERRNRGAHSDSLRAQPCDHGIHGVSRTRDRTRSQRPSAPVWRPSPRGWSAVSSTVRRARARQEEVGASVDGLADAGPCVYRRGAQGRCTTRRTTSSSGSRRATSSTVRLAAALGRLIRLVVAR